jgi:phage virion morphogenesis protein
MAGSFIQVNVTGTKQLTALLNKFIQQGQNLEPAFREIGEYLIESHQERFRLEVAPDGELWEPLNPNTIAKKGNDRILRDSGTLADTLAYQISGDQLEFGTNREYAATHQFGREADGIPARPFLGLSTGLFNDGDEIIAILQSHLLS